MVAASKKLKAGADGDAFLGPVSNKMQYDKIKDLLDDIDREHLQVIAGDRRADGAGYFINPTIIDRPSDDSRIVVEEPFGKCFCSTMRRSHRL